MTDADHGSGDTAVCLVVPHGTWHPDPVADAIRAQHPTWRIIALWCGDPQLRPPSTVSWWHDGSCAGPDAAWERTLVGSEPRTAEWSRALDAVTDVLAAGGAARVVVLIVGDVAVMGDLSALAAETAAPLTLVPRTREPLPDDGASPNEADRLRAGHFSTSVAVIGRPALGPAGALTWLRRHLAGGGDAGRGLEVAAHLFGASVCDDGAIGVGPWRWASAAPALLDVPGFDTEEPWVLDAAMTSPAREVVVGETAREKAIARAAPQLAGRRSALTLPGGIRVDATVRAVVAEAGAAAPAPWSDAATFRGWLEQRYWTAARERRADVDRAFPDAAGRDAPFFTQWCRNAFTVDDVPFLLRHHAERAQRWEAPTGATAPGVNLVGYLTRDFSLGDVARRLATALAEAEIPHASLPFERSASPVLEWPGASTHVRHATTIAVVTADQFPLLARDHPELFDVTERMIGYWFWELAQVPRGMRPSLDLVDEIWAPTAFVADAFSAEAKVPVHHVPLAIAQPRASPRTRTSFEALRDAADRIVFLVAFDHLSVTERKNPVAVIDAFTEAFEAGEGPLLLVKSTNGRLRWPQHQRVLAAARHRDDVRVWDAHLSREDQMALVAASDCFVSLHRSEGLGLHLAEAMWLGVPTIATRYSGNLDFMDDSCSMLVDATLVPVGSAGQGVYPPDATWADPDVAGAAGAMRTVAADAGMRARLAGAGRERMEQQRRVDTSPRLRELLGGAGADPMSRRAAGAAARMR